MWDTDVVTIIGGGSLLSEESARRTCPTLENFRLGKLPDYVRTYSKVDPLSSRFDHKNIACWGFVEKTGHTSLISLFEIKRADYAAFVRREGEYDLKYLECVDENGRPDQGIACCVFETNEEFIDFLETAPIQREHYYETTYPAYKGPIWRKDVLPRPKYLAFVLEISKKLGDVYVENMLEASFLADETTSIKTYLQDCHEDLEYIKELDWLAKHLF